MSIEYSYAQSPDFTYLIQELQNPAGALNQFRSFILDKRRSDIQAGIDPYGHPYAPLSPEYAAVKRRKYGDRPILLRSNRAGNMRSMHRVSVQGSRLVESYATPIAQYHQTGTKKMPKRLLLPDDRGLPDAEQNKLLDLVEKAIERSWQKR